MLDAKADGKRLGLDVDAAVEQHLRRCRGRCGPPPARHDRRRSLRRFPAARRAVCRVSISIRSVTLLWKRYSPPRLSMVCAQDFHHRHQPEGADMGMGFGENFFRRAGLDEFGQHLAAQMARILDLAVELAVGESAGAAFAELDIGFRGEHRSCATSAQVSLVRSRTTLPRSRMMGRKPICARIRAANNPHGPAPITSGRANFSGARATNL